MSATLQSLNPDPTGRAAPAQVSAEALQVVVMGVSGSGKSTIGALLAHSLEIPFLDADGLHPQSNIVKMASGVPLTDDDRWPWLALVGAALADAGAAGTGLVIACSALKRVYRDAILQAAPNVRFVHLAGSLEVLGNRLEGRSEHFMPPALLRSQLATLEELQTGEPGFAVDIDQPVLNVVAESVARLDAPALPASVTIGIGRGGLPVVRVDGAAGAAEVYLQGAHVTSFTPAGQPPVLWMSALSEFAAGRPLRGGVPVCFPWFGPLAADPTAPAHGFARIADWQLTEAREAGDDVVLVFRLTDSAQTRSSAWPHRFEVHYTVTVGARLGLSLQVRNLDAETVTFQEAFHTYLSVSDIQAVQVSGFEGLPFIDRLAGPDQQVAETRPVTVSGETDRIYLGTSADARVSDGSGRTVTISTEGSASRVLWNPWIAKAAAMPDFGDAEWTGMLCVETANVLSDAIVLAPGESHTMSAVITPST
ncbi:gluconokinase, GntK/IdnK-type [Cryobacterium sp. AP23]